jgi:hypothetical protein
MDGAAADDTSGGLNIHLISYGGGSRLDVPDGGSGGAVPAIGLRQNYVGISPSIDERPALPRGDDTMDVAGSDRIGTMDQNIGADEARRVAKRSSVEGDLSAGPGACTLQSSPDSKINENHLTVMEEGQEFVKIRIGTRETPPLEIVSSKFLTRREIESLFVLKLNVRCECKWFGDGIVERG